MKSVLMLLTVLLAFLPASQAAEEEEEKPFDITTIYGETYHGCRIMKVTPAAIIVTYDSGVAKLQFPLLGEEWKRRYRYDEERARTFEKEEQIARLAAEEKHIQLRKQREREEMLRMKNLGEQEKKLLAEEAKRNAAPPPLAPMPGDPNVAKQQPVVSTEIVVPPVTPLGQPYTPSVKKSQTTVVPDGGVLIIPGSPTYVVPPAGCPPNYYNPYGNMPGAHIIPGTNGQIIVGPSTVRINR